MPTRSENTVKYQEHKHNDSNAHLYKEFDGWQKIPRLHKQFSSSASNTSYFAES
jgi:hypothetical protein